MTLVIQLREGQLVCLDCGEFVTNTANHEMKREGTYSHSHSCKENVEVRRRLFNEITVSIS